MSKNIIYVFGMLLICLNACKSTKYLGGKTFTFKSNHRKLEFFFDNDSVCRLKNTFFCKDVNLDIRELTSFCKYKVSKDTVYLKNVNCSTNDCKYDLFRQIPSLQSNICPFLTKLEQNSKVTVIGGNYLTEYEKFALIPNIDVDTAYILMNKIILIKQDGEKSCNFIFK